MKTCTVDGCNRQIKGHGMCRLHLYRMRRDAAPPRPQREVRLCTVDGCGRKHAAGGLCASHYMTARRGAPLVTSAQREAERADMTARARAAYASGMTVLQVAAELGIGHVRARRLIGDAFDPGQANRLRAKTVAAYQAKVNPARAPKPTPPPKPAAPVPPRLVPVVDLGLPPLAPIRWDPTATTERQAMIAVAAIHRCSGDRRAAARMLGIPHDTLMGAVTVARRLGLAA